jgi:hypothetical protein
MAEESSETNSGTVPLAFFRNKSGGAVFPVFSKEHLKDAEKLYDGATQAEWEEQKRSNSTVGFKKGTKLPSENVG